MKHALAAQSQVDVSRHPDSLLLTQREHCREVLILTSSTGAGHDSVAVALRQALHELAPEISVRILDPLAGGRENGPLSARRWYDALATHAPWLWGLLYHATNNAWTVRHGMAAGGRLWARGLRSSLESERPGIVVAVHPLCMRLAAGILRTLPAAPPLHCVVTDLVTIHRCWASDAVAGYYVATSEARDALLAMGIPGERVEVTGLPLRMAFAQTPSTQAASEIPRVLLLGGGYPARHTEKVARALLLSRAPLRLIVVCGRNTRLRQRLTRALGDRATVLGWREDIAALMRWSSIVITKGGPTTVTEALSQARPVVISHALPGQEAGNVALVTRTGSGCYLPDVNALVRMVAAHRCAWPTGRPAQADWWGDAAQRVAAHLLTARADSSTAPRGSARQVDEIMAAGHVIENPISGERIVIRVSGAQTGGQLLSFDLYLPPGAHVPSRHAHPVQEEKFTVVAGQMRFRLGHRRRTILANPGDTIAVPAGTAHWFGNTGTGIAHARVEVRPALRMEELFEAAATMSVARYVPGVRMSRLSDLALFLGEFQQELAVPEVPALLVRAVLAPLAWLGRRRRVATPGSAK